MELATPQITSSNPRDPGPVTPASARRPPQRPRNASTADGAAGCWAGVAAGLADYLDVDPTLVRIGFVALTLLGGVAVPLYLAGLAAHP